MKAPFFITGEQRSGTTLLSVLLGRHSEIDIDGNALGFRIVSCYKQYGRVLPFNLHHSMSEIQSWLIKDDYKGRLARFIDYQGYDQYPNAREAIKAGIERRLQKSKKSVFGDKAPGLHMFIPDLIELVPNAKILHIVRDGRAVAWSKHRRAGRNLLLAANDWFEGNVLGLSHQAILGQDQLMIIRYEDLVTAPATTLKKVSTFLGLSFEPAMLHDHKGELESSASYVKDGFKQEKLNAYADEMTGRQIERVEKIQGPLLLRFGYELAKTKITGPYREMPVLKHVLLTQLELVGRLFVSKQEGMIDRKTKTISIPLISRIKHFVYWSCFNLMPEKVFRRYTRSRHIKNEYID